MKNALPLLALGILLLATPETSPPRAAAQASGAQAGRSPVIVELFTSEGCSSCPPADALLAKLEGDQPIPDADVIALEEHVDYWNHDGWIDSFSSGEWTQRQQDYVARFNGKGPYTPQMIVDGQSQFDDDARQAAQAIEAAAHRAKTAVDVVPEAPGAKGTEKFNVEVGSLEGNTPGDTAEVWLAVTESGLHSAVDAGENAGHDLHHASIVRALHKIGVASGNKSPSSFTGEVAVKIKGNWKRENLQFVVFVQEKKSFHILGAASARIAG
jgi:hypothetical protein